MLEPVPNPTDDSTENLEIRRLVAALLDLLVASDPYGPDDVELISARHEARVLLRRHLGT